MNRQEILKAVRKEWDSRLELPFIKGKSDVPVSGAIIDTNDIVATVDAVLDGWFTEWRVAHKFSDELSKYVRVKHAVLCNSGSSASLLALSALVEKYRSPETSYIVTCATGFPTTIAPIIQNDHIPLFIDIDPRTLNPRIEDIIGALCREDVVGVVLAHTLGFPLPEVMTIRSQCDILGKFFLEDNCDGLGGTYLGQKLGGFGHASLLSFFPAHHITTGEGGCVLTNDEELSKLVRSYRDWGRDCVCLPGQNNTCGERFSQEHGTLPFGYDHKYVFSRMGYNLKMTEIQAALGLSQLDKIDKFADARRWNYMYLMMALEALQTDYIRLYNISNDVSPFGFPITVTNSDYDKQDFVEWLEGNGIRTRPVFAGNITRQPMMNDIYYDVLGNLLGSDYVMNNTFWVGCHPALSVEQLNWIVECVWEFFK